MKTKIIKEILKDISDHIINSNLDDNEIKKVKDIINLDCLREEIEDQPKMFNYTLEEFEIVVKEFVC